MKKSALNQFAMTIFATIIAFIALSAARPVSAFAEGASGFTAGFSFMKLDTATDGPNLGNNTISTTVMNGKLGYVMSEGLYVGGIYDSRTDETNGSKNERSGYGVSVGYHNSGWFLDGSYFLSSTVKLAGGTELTNGSGFGADLGRNFDLTANLYLGLQISYRSFTYTQAASTSATNKYKSELMPLLNLGVSF